MQKKVRILTLLCEITSAESVAKSSPEPMFTFFVNIVLAVGGRVDELYCILMLFGGLGCVGTCAYMQKPLQRCDCYDNTAAIDVGT